MGVLWNKIQGIWVRVIDGSELQPDIPPEENTYEKYAIDEVFPIEFLPVNDYFKGMHPNRYIRNMNNTNEIHWFKGGYHVSFNLETKVFQHIDTMPGMASGDDEVLGIGHTHIQLLYNYVYLFHYRIAGDPNDLSLRFYNFNTNTYTLLWTGNIMEPLPVSKNKTTHYFNELDGIPYSVYYNSSASSQFMDLRTYTSFFPLQPTIGEEDSQSQEGGSYTHPYDYQNQYTAKFLNGGLMNWSGTAYKFITPTYNGTYYRALETLQTNSYTNDNFPITDLPYKYYYEYYYDRLSYIGVRPNISYSTNLTTHESIILRENRTLVGYTKPISIWNSPGYFDGMQRVVMESPNVDELPPCAPSMSKEKGFPWIINDGIMYYFDLDNSLLVKLHKIDNNI